MDTKNFEVGQVWMTRRGEEAVVTHVGDLLKDSYPIVCGFGDEGNRTYTATGGYFEGDDECDLDLVSLIVPEPEGVWITNSGNGGTPVDGHVAVDVAFRNGEVDYSSMACRWSWFHTYNDHDIVSYRVVGLNPSEQNEDAPIVEPTPPSSTSVKETNPKDAVGIRKAPLSVVPMNVIAEVGVGIMEGAAKYGRHNYRGVGVRSSVYFDATMRHLIDYWEGEDIDPASDISHVTKAICSLVVWRDAMMQDKCEDDRPPRSKPFYATLNEKAAAIIDMHKDKNPHHYTIKDVV